MPCNVVRRIRRYGVIAAVLSSAVLVAPAPALAAGQTFRVEPGTSWIIFRASWEYPGVGVTAQVTPPKGEPVAQADFDGTDMSIVEEMSKGNAIAVMVVGPRPGLWRLELSAEEDNLGTITYAAEKSAQAPRIVNMTPKEDITGGEVLITFDAYDEDSDTPVALYYDNDRNGTNGRLLTDEIVEADGPVEFLWDTSKLPDGDYYVYAVANDGHNPPVTVYSEGRVRISSGADLVLLKESTSHVAAGMPITYTLTVVNAGPIMAEDVVLTEELPEALDLVDVQGPKPEQRGNRMLFSLGDMPAGKEQVVSMSVLAPDREGWVTNLATARSATLDPIAGNDAMTITTRVYEGLPPVADVTVEHSVMPEKLPMGRPIEYALTVSNNGPGRATGVAVDEHLPRIVNFVEATPSQGGVERDGVRVRWTVGDLDPGESASIDFLVGPVAIGQISKMSTVKANEDDPETGNNECVYFGSRIVPDERVDVMTAEIPK